eukprot:1327965-Pyramimonas_sp.AAC.1
MQTAPLSRDVCAAYTNALQLLVVGPRFSLNYEMLPNLTSLGFPGKYKNLQGVFWATKFRLVSRCSEIQSSKIWKRCLRVTTPVLHAPRRNGPARLLPP